MTEEKQRTTSLHDGHAVELIVRQGILFGSAMSKLQVRIDDLADTLTGNEYRQLRDALDDVRQNGNTTYNLVQTVLQAQLKASSAIIPADRSDWDMEPEPKIVAPVIKVKKPLVSPEPEVSQEAMAVPEEFDGSDQTENKNKAVADADKQAADKAVEADDANAADTVTDDDVLLGTDVLDVPEVDTTDYQALNNAKMQRDTDELTAKINGVPLTKDSEPDEADDEKAETEDKNTEAAEDEADDNEADSDAEAVDDSPLIEDEALTTFGKTPLGDKVKTHLINAMNDRDYAAAGITDEADLAKLQAHDRLEDEINKLKTRLDDGESATAAEDEALIKVKEQELTNLETVAFAIMKGKETTALKTEMVQALTDKQVDEAGRLLDAHGMPYALDEAGKTVIPSADNSDEAAEPDETDEDAEAVSDSDETTD